MADIFDKITKGVNKGIATVGANSKAVVEKAKVNAAIDNLESERSNLIQLLGAKVYSILAENSSTPGDSITVDEGIANFTAEINKRNELIAELHEQLKKIEEEVNLVTGGEKADAQGSALCKCGHGNVEGAKFCAKCGSQL